MKPWVIRPAETIPFPEDDETTCFPSGQIFTDLESGRDQMAERNAACENEKQDYRLAVSHSSKKGYAYDYIFRVVPVRNFNREYYYSVRYNHAQKVE